MFSKKELHILGLSTRDNAILNYLKETNGALVSNIAREVNLPRTTVHFLLRKLKDRGLVLTVPIRSHVEWRMEDSIAISTQFHKILEHFNSKPNIQKNAGSKVPEIITLQGKKTIVDAYNQILQIDRGNRVFFLQGNESARTALKEIDYQFILDFHQAFKKSGIIMEGIMSESTLKLFDNLDTQQLNSHLGRMVIAYVAPNHYLDFDVDLVVSRKQVIIVNIKERKVIVINDEPTANALYTVSNALSLHARKIDLNKLIKELLSNKKQLLC